MHVFKTAKPLAKASYPLNPKPMGNKKHPPFRSADCTCPYKSNERLPEGDLEVSISRRAPI